MYKICLVNPNYNTKSGLLLKTNKIKTFIINIWKQISRKEIYKTIFPRLIKFYAISFLGVKKSYVRSQL